MSVANDLWFKKEVFRKWLANHPTPENVGLGLSTDKGVLPHFLSDKHKRGVTVDDEVWHAGQSMRMNLPEWARWFQYHLEEEENKPISREMCLSALEK